MNLNILIKIGYFFCLKYFNTSRQNMVPLGKMFQYPQVVCYLGDLCSFARIKFRHLFKNLVNAVKRELKVRPDV